MIQGYLYIEGTDRFAEEHDIRFYETATIPTFTVRDRHVSDCLFYLFCVEGRKTIYASLSGEAAVGFHEPVRGDARLALERVDVLREACVEQAAVGKQLHEGVRERRPEAPGVKLAGQAEDWLHDAVHACPRGQRDWIGRG